MAIKIIEIHPADEATALNTEWFVIENDGERPFSTRNCAMTVTRKGQKKRQELGVIDPGFSLAPGSRVRVHTGTPGRKEHGELPKDDVQIYHLFLNDSILRGEGSVLTMTLRGLPVTKVTFDPAAENGVRKPA